MVNGSLEDKLIVFALPLIAANMLQLLFNAADVIVVGRYAGSLSLAAVGSTTSVIYLFINVLMGLSVGVNVIIARYLGMAGGSANTVTGASADGTGTDSPAAAGNTGAAIPASESAGKPDPADPASPVDALISRTVHTSVTVGIIGGIAVGLFGIAMSGPVLKLMGVPDDVYPLACLYIRIYFAGTIFNMLYNYGAAALRAKGDTQRPLYYLTFSGVLNVILNLFFVIVLRLDVAGVALATISSQAVSAFLVLRCLAKEKGPLQFSVQRLCLDLPILADMARIGVPAGLQMSLFSIANMTIQSAINSYGSVTMAGSSASLSLESFMYSAMSAFHQTSQTFTSQNVGAGKLDRVDRVVRACLLYTTVVAVGVAAFMYVFRYPLLRIYNTDPAVVEAGVTRLIIMVIPYFLYGMADVFVGAIRGMGHALSPVIATLVCTCLLRVLWVLLLDTGKYSVEWVYYCFPITWLLMFVVAAVLWHVVRRKAG